MNLNKLVDTQGLKLSRGAHAAGEGTCVMEAVAWLAGEEHTDRPDCTAPIIAKIMMRWNDRLPSDAERKKWLGPLIVHVVGTNHPELDRQRAYICADAVVRKIIPLALRARGNETEAVRLEQLPEIVNKETALAGKEAADAIFAAIAAIDAAAYSVCVDAALHKIMTDAAYSGYVDAALNQTVTVAAYCGCADADLNQIMTDLILALCFCSDGINSERDNLIACSLTPA